jgi:23S rRNA (cytosine1962-C5)-methyltransferase
LKAHKSANPDPRRGIFLYGDSFDRHISENHVRYSIDLQLNQDASFYLDTRNLRIWAKNNMRGMSVLNTFSYTGSLGVAARAGNSRRVVHLDRYRKFLDIARTSYVLNGFPVKKSDFITGDFWRVTSHLRHSGELFDCVIVDPPVYAQSNTGVVDLVSESSRVINKVRPLVGHDGYLVVVNNALFLSGADFMQALADLCASGYMQLETTIPVPEDIAITAQRRAHAAPVDPAPFNHSTKIAILRVKRKDGHRA